jgi:hypothetical protein
LFFLDQYGFSSLLWCPCENRARPLWTETLVQVIICMLPGHVYTNSKYLGKEYKAVKMPAEARSLTLPTAPCVYRCFPTCRSQCSADKTQISTGFLIFSTAIFRTKFYQSLVMGDRVTASNSQAQEGPGGLCKAAYPLGLF